MHCESLQSFAITFQLLQVRTNEIKVGVNEGFRSVWAPIASCPILLPIIGNQEPEEMDADDLDAELW
jgi:hypothetical protein